MTVKDSTVRGKQVKTLLKDAKSLCCFHSSRPGNFVNKDVVITSQVREMNNDTVNYLQLITSPKLGLYSNPHCLLHCCRFFPVPPFFFVYILVLFLFCLYFSSIYFFPKKITFFSKKINGRKVDE